MGRPRAILLPDRGVSQSGREVGVKTETMTTDTDTVLRRLRLLPARERLRVVLEVLPETEDELPATSSIDRIDRQAVPGNERR